MTLVVMAAPPFGGDFGAALAGAPGFALLAWLLLGRRVRAGPCVLLGVILVASGLLVGIVDMLRPTSQQTHVGRFFDRVTRGRLQRLLPRDPPQGDGELRIVHVHPAWSG